MTCHVIRAFKCVREELFVPCFWDYVIESCFQVNSYIGISILIDRQRCTSVFDKDVSYSNLVRKLK
jgi:hypothetical protein